MCIYTQSLVVLSEVEWAKLSFIMKHIEILIILIIVNQLYSDFILAMSKRAILSILTFFNISGEMRTKFFLISLVLIKLLNS